jgi:hypothetical protein
MATYDFGAVAVSDLLHGISIQGASFYNNTCFSVTQASSIDPRGGAVSHTMMTT